MNIILLLFLSTLGFSQSQSLVPTQTFLSDDAYSSFFLGKVFSGGDSIGGGDNVDSRRHAAWFYGESDIQVCFQLSEYFGLASSEVESNILKVIQTWSHYFSESGIGQNLEKSQRINLNFKLKKSCMGGEDLVLYFGTGPIFGNLDDLRARQMLSRPVAYVNKTHISQNLKWSKGYIRFVEPEIYYYKDQLYFPDWKKGESFYNILLHEFGHLLGFEHKNGTIMKKTISVDNLVLGTDSVEKSTIDQTQNLFSCNQCEIKYTSTKLSFNKIQSIQIDSNNKITLTKNDNNAINANIIDTLYSEPTLNLLSFIEFNNYETKTPYLYFIEINGVHYTLEVKNLKLNLRLNGNLVAIFEMEKK